MRRGGQSVGRGAGQGVPAIQRGAADAEKKVNGRKRHMLVDTLGLILAVVVTAASVQDDEGAKRLFGSIRGRFSRLRLVWADGIYKRVADWVAAWRPALPVRLEVVERTARGSRSSSVGGWWSGPSPGWGRNRRLSKGYEGTIASSEAFVKLAMCHLMARRLVKKLDR